MIEHDGEIDGLPVFWRSSGTDGGGPTPLYLHGVPTSSDEWLPFMERGARGVAVDLPGFGRSGKPGHFDYSIPGYVAFLERFLGLAGLERVVPVVHDWGAVGLAFATAHPQRIAGLVVINAVPLMGDYRWHRWARIWRTPLLGELAMGSTSPWLLKRVTIGANVTPGPLPQEWRRTVWSHFDQGTQRAILRLYRSADPDVLARAGDGLGSLDVPALVVWGQQDPYIPARFGADYADRLGARLLTLPDAGHWPWLDRPDMIDDVLAFLDE